MTLFCHLMGALFQSFETRTDGDSVWETKYTQIFKDLRVFNGDRWLFENISESWRWRYVREDRPSMV